MKRPFHQNLIIKKHVFPYLFFQIEIDQTFVFFSKVLHQGKILNRFLSLLISLLLMKNLYEQIRYHRTLFIVNIFVVDSEGRYGREKTVLSYKVSVGDLCKKLTFNLNIRIEMLPVLLVNNKNNFMTRWLGNMPRKAYN